MKKSWILLMLIILAVSGCVSSTNKGEYSDAVSYYKRATELEPQDGFRFLNLCKVYYGNHQYQEAVDACKKALNLPHNNEVEWDSWQMISMAYSALGQIDSAISSQKKVVELLPNDSNAFTLFSYLYSKNKQYDEAITAAKRAIELKPDNKKAYSNLGYAYGMKKQYDEAIKALKKAIEIDPKMSNEYGWMGRLLMEKNAYNEAAEAYKKGIEAAPSKPDLYESLARAYYRMGRYDDAIAAANRAIELQTIPGDVGLAIGSNSKDNYPFVAGVDNPGPAKKADIQFGDKILKVDGKSTKGWTDKEISQNIFRGAAGTQVTLTIQRKGIDKPFEKLITRETTTKKIAVDSFGLRSLINRSKGNQEGAFQDAEKAYSLDSGNYWAQLSLGAAYLDRGQYDESIKLLAQVKDSPTARLLEATAYAKKGKAKEAATIYLSIPEEKISPKNVPQTHDRMVLLQTFKPIVKEHRNQARALESKGQHKEALAELSEALKIADDTEAQAIQETIFSMIRRNPLLAEFSEMPEDARKYALRSEVLLKAGNLEQAATELKKAIQIAPYAARLYYSSALINAELKRYPEAIRNMKIYLKAAPDAPNARAAKDEIVKWEFMMEKEGR